MVSRVVPLTLTQVLYRGAGARKEALNPFTASAGGPRKWVHSGLTPTVDLRQHLVSGPRVNTSHLEHVQVSHPHTKLLRIPSFFPNPEESPLPSVPAIAKSGSLDSELSVSPKRNSISRTHKDKGPFHILSSTSQTNKVAEGPSPAPVPASASTRLFGLAKPKEKKEKKKKNKGSRSQSGGESHAPALPVPMVSPDPAGRVDFGSVGRV